MYNSFIADRKSKDKNAYDSRDKKIRSWFSRYKTEVQPNLVKNFNKRINGFAKKMEDEPLIVNQEQQLPHQKIFRVSNRKLNLTQASFHYKDQTDWNTISPSYQRYFRQNNNKSALEKTLNQSSQNNHLSAPKYKNRKIEYRSRNKEKQIQPPMRFNPGSSSQKNKCGKNKGKNDRSLKDQQENSAYFNANISRQSLESDGRDSDFGSISDIDLMSLYNYSISHKKTENRKSQLQIIKQKQLKALAHEKIYFKSLLELANSTKNRKQKQDIRETLRKCKVVRNLNENRAKEEVDKFIELLKN